MPTGSQNPVKVSKKSERNWRRYVELCDYFRSQNILNVCKRIRFYFPTARFNGTFDRVLPLNTPKNLEWMERLKAELEKENSKPIDYVARKEKGRRPSKKDVGRP